MSSHRSFTVVDVATHSGRTKGKANLGGRFVSRTPASAAKKAATQICRESKIKGQCALDVTIQETTRGSLNKTYTYSVKRVKDPVTVERNGVEITYKYRTVVKAKK
jgi:hypothetical protein